MFGVYNSPKPIDIYIEKLIIEDAFELVNGGILFFSKMIIKEWTMIF